MADSYVSKKIILTVTKDGEKVYCSPWVRTGSETEFGVFKVDGVTIKQVDGVISATAGGGIVDDHLDSSSENPVQNKAIDEALKNKAELSHTQASDTIDVMTGYEKGEAEESIAASDSLNTAIGKLEYKIDDVDTQLQALVQMLNEAASS